jgi:hypothetical protein
MLEHKVGVAGLRRHRRHRSAIDAEFPLREPLEVAYERQRVIWYFESER